MPFLIVGLGNPGARYATTRHNVGWWVLDAFAKRHGISVDKVGFQGVYGEHRAAQDRLFLLKPMTFMNLSGQSVAPLSRFYKITPDRIMVVYDDLDLPPGKLRLREKGSAGGHNGMKSLIKELGTEEFPRLRIGIGRPAPGWQVPDWVLAPFGPDDAASIAQALPHAVDALDTWLKDGLTIAMNRFNAL